MPCPICDKSSVPAFKPFCSDRCKQIDLGKWLVGSYTVPVVEFDDIDEGDIPEEGEQPS
jgi:endogenous inhibitor of DNA gyrase (YacG/DUF329 family)